MRTSNRLPIGGNLKAMKKVYLVCNAHLDPVWLWGKNEGIGEALSTFRIAVDFCENEDFFVFNHNESVLYEWILNHEPALFERIKKAVKAGKWNIMGGWYLQPDCNMPSGDSIIGQIQTGHDFFKKHFGDNFCCKTAINFDSFGHNKGLVQILEKAGYEGYMVCRPNPTMCKLPSNHIKWHGANNSRVNVHRNTDGYGNLKGKAVEKILNSVKSNTDETMIVLWGIGNHGGGPSKEDYDKIKKLINKEDFILSDNSTNSAGLAGADLSDTEMHKDETTTNKLEIPQDVTFINAGVDDYFAKAEDAGLFSKSYYKSLVSWGIGCYTTQCRIKQKHKKLESELAVAKKMATIASINVPDYVYPAEILQTAQKDLLFCEFHDVLPGSSTKPVEETSIIQLDHGIELVENVKTSAFFALTSGQEFTDRGDKIPVLVYNPHPYKVKTIVTCELQQAEQNWEDEFSNPVIYKDDERVPSQCIKEDSNINLDWRKKISFEATLPPMQMSRYICQFELVPARPKSKLIPQNGKYTLTTKNNLMFSIDTTKGLVDIEYKDKKVAANAFLPVVINDDEDPWAMNVTSFREKIGEFTIMTKEQVRKFNGYKYEKEKIGSIYSNVSEYENENSVRVIEDGELFTKIEVMYQYNRSVICQVFTIPKTDENTTYSCVDIDITVWYMEPSTMLKLAIPYDKGFDSYVGQGMFIQEEKETTGDEVVAGAYTIALSENIGSCVLNKGTYGSSYENNTQYISLLRTPCYSTHPINDRIYVPYDRTNPRIDLGERTFSFRIMIGEAEGMKQIADKQSQIYNEQPLAVPFYPSGKGEKYDTYMELDNDLVTVTMVERIEDKIIIRLFNGTRQEQDLNLRITDRTYNISIMPDEFMSYEFDLITEEIKELKL